MNNPLADHRLGRLGRYATLVLLCTFALFCHGCMLGWALSGTMGAQVQKAQFTLAKVPTLVLVENYAEDPRGNVDADRLSADIGETLAEHKAVPIIPMDNLARFREANPNTYPHMTIAEIGRALRARQVLYVNIKSYAFDTPAGSDKVHGTVLVFVKVVSTDTGQSIWPADSVEGDPVTAQSDYADADPNGINMDAKLDLNDTLSDKIGQLFYDYQPDFDSDVMGD
ncbi:MAG TPA: hypothetical protein VMD30_11280 [Tepidisphaeraceae bacterium]|nr:hypothetical protein [Tepidisphaeraceae bacterium]